MIFYCFLLPLSLQEFLPDTGQTSQNSMSLQRAPGALANDIRGSSLNFPFWPGNTSTIFRCKWVTLFTQTKTMQPGHNFLWVKVLFSSIESDRIHFDFQVHLK